ncbi:UNVERIFIED_CONTAM: hypothetical protein DES50_12324 [Williamsia faeni]
MTTSEVDEALQHFTTSMRIGLAAASQIAERQARLREQRNRNVAAESEQERRELNARMVAQQKSAEASFTRIYRREWWQDAEPIKIATAYRAVSEWQELSSVAAAARQHMDEQIQQRYGISPAEVHAARSDIQELIRRAEQQRDAGTETDLSNRDEAVAVALLRQSDAEDRAAQGVAVDGENRDAAEARVDQDSGADHVVAQEVYDSAERRSDLRDHLKGLGVDDEATSARLSADLDQAAPPEAAVSSGGPRRSPTGRKNKFSRRRGRQHDRGR